MNPLRSAPAALCCIPLLALGACGQDVAATTSSSSSSASSPSVVAPASSVPASTADKALCNAVEKAGQVMKTKAINVLSAGPTTDPADFKKILGDFARSMDTAAAKAGNSAVVTAVRNMGAVAAEAAAAPNPIDNAADPKFEEAGAEVTTACAETGVKVNF